MKNFMILLACISFLAVSCSSYDLGQAGTSEVGAVSGKYNTIKIVGNYMYAVNNTELITFDLTDDSNPVEIDKKDVGTAIENIYHAENALFIGSRTHLHIYEVGLGGIPAKKSDTEYMNFGNSNAWGNVTPCDPVVASNDIAYVTLSSTFMNFDDPCGSTMDVNELRSYNVENLSQPLLVKTELMNNPQGLSVDGNYLFVSDGESGFSVFQVDHTGSMTLVTEVKGFAAYDLIAEDGKLLVVSPDEIRQYDYSNINDIRLYSTLSLR